MRFSYVRWRGRIAYRFSKIHISAYFHHFMWWTVTRCRIIVTRTFRWWPPIDSLHSISSSNIPGGGTDKVFRRHFDDSGEDMRSKQHWYDVELHNYSGKQKTSLCSWKKVLIYTAIEVALFIWNHKVIGWLIATGPDLQRTISITNILK